MIDHVAQIVGYRIVDGVSDEVDYYLAQQSKRAVERFEIARSGDILQVTVHLTGQTPFHVLCLGLFRYLVYRSGFSAFEFVTTPDGELFDFVTASREGTLAFRCQVRQFPGV